MAALSLPAASLAPALALGRTAAKTYLEMQPGDATDTWADISLLEELTGYRPSTPLAEGIARTVRWYRDQRA